MEVVLRRQRWLLALYGFRRGSAYFRLIRLRLSPSLSPLPFTPTMYLTTLPPIEPFYVTSPDLTKENWREKSEAKRAERDALIPPAWRLPASVLEDEERTDVTEVPGMCGLLNERELEITEIDDLGEVRLFSFLFSLAADPSYRAARQASLDWSLHRG